MGFWSKLAPRAAPPASGLATHTGEWEALFGQTGAGADIPLGTARWMAPDAAIKKFRYSASSVGGRVWIGQGFDVANIPLGYEDDRHVCLVSGSRGGKGVGVIVPNLCFWPGSSIVVDPKGENATVTARRRGGGSEYAHPLGQKVCILDPFGEVQLPGELKARYNPLDAIDPESDVAVDDAGRIAAALVVVESRTDPYWELAARNLIKGLILHVLSARTFKERRNLITVRRLLTQGDWLSRAADNSDGAEFSAFGLLWTRMQRSTAFNGVVAGVGEQMVAMADKQRSGVLEAARTNTEFLDSSPMQRLLETSDFDLGELKTNPRGLTIYLTLPQRFMETHYRWLRLMIVLAVGEMERIKGRPATGQPTLFLLDEFAGLKRMEVIEHAAAQAAGFGIKFLFVVQNLAQLSELYEKSWETFFGNSGLKMFFQIDDDFTRSYVSRQLGELESRRHTQSGSQSQSTSWSTSDGRSYSTNDGTSYGTADGSSTGYSKNYGGLFAIFLAGRGRQRGRNWSRSRTTSSGSSEGTSYTRSQSGGDSTTSGWAEGLHKRPLLNPDEIGRLLARVDDRSRPGYPGLVLALTPGEHPLLTRRVNYFESPWFSGYFDPHPNHPPPPTLAELARKAAAPPLKQLRESRSSFEQILADFLQRLVLLIKGLFRWTVRIAVLAAVVLVAVHLFRVWLTPQATKPGESSPSAANGNRSAAPSSAPAPVTAYSRGVADWDALQAWFTTQTGDRRAGADYWAANRSVAGHDDCSDAAADYQGDRPLFITGCHDAEQRLDPIDQNRHADPQYRAGFSDEAKHLPLAPQAPTAASLGSGSEATVSTINLNLRAGPGPDYDAVLVMPEGTRVKIIREADNGWKEIEAPGSDGQAVHGFVNGIYLTPAP